MRWRWRASGAASWHRHPPHTPMLSAASRLPSTLCGGITRRSTRYAYTHMHSFSTASTAPKMLPGRPKRKAVEPIAPETKRRVNRALKGANDAAEDEQVLRTPFVSKESKTKNGEEAPDAISSNGPARRAGKPNDTDFIQSKYYPPEMTNDRVQAYIGGAIPRPIEELEKALKTTAEQRERMGAKDAVVHWFRWDLRLADNTALCKAYEAAKEAGKPLICLYVFSHQDFDAHCTSAARIDFSLRTLEILKKDLAALDIPLWVEEVHKRKTAVEQVVELCASWGVGKLFGNMEYEVDELRRDAQLVLMGLEKGIAVDILHDTAIVPPSALHSGAGKIYAVYSPYFRAWVPYVKTHRILENVSPAPRQNAGKARKAFPDLFNQASLPKPASNKLLPPEELKKLSKIWPAGEHEAHSRLAKFITENINTYKDKRNFPSDAHTSSLSVHFSSGTLSARQAAAAAVAANHGKIDTGSDGICNWISEIAWRDFYKAVLVNWPHVCMHKPFKPEYSNIEWEYNHEHFDAWCQGRTGYPFVDAAMRQLNTVKWMHNRARMVVASFLAKHLLLDWRKGERYFLEVLIDHDFASNSGGWGFSSSAGVDPQPYFRIFNPLLQSEKFDSDGEYIREWVPELKGVTGKAIHAPHERLSPAEFKKLGYPKPIVEHKFARDRCLARYKEGLGRNTS